MSSPAIYIPPPAPEELANAIQGEVRRQQEATPEPKFQENDAIQSYDYLCHIEHQKFSPNEVDNLRMGITDPFYYECEAGILMDELSKLIWKNLLQQCRATVASNADSWRDVVQALRRRLCRHGYSKQQVRQSRLSIDDQKYWEPEAVRLRAESAFREAEMQERYRNMNKGVEGTPNYAVGEVHCESLDEDASTKDSTRRPRRPKGSARLQRASRRSERSGPRNSTTSKVGKRCGATTRQTRLPF